MKHDLLRNEVFTPSGLDPDLDPSGVRTGGLEGVQFGTISGGVKSSPPPFGPLSDPTPNLTPNLVWIWPRSGVDLR